MLGKVGYYSDNVLNHICDEMHAKSLLEKLESLYAQMIDNNKIFLIKKMMNLHCKEDSTIFDYLSYFQGIL